jgi:cytoskeletal protein CcmA (bactofilin family)
MNCRPELDCLMYVDGELAADDIAAFEAHLALCAGCRQRVSALRNEAELIREIVQRPEAVIAPSPVSARAGLLWAMLALVAVGAGVNACLDILAQLNAQLGWLSPLSEEQHISALLSLAFWLPKEGLPMLFTVFAALTIALLGFLSLGLARRRRLVVVAGLLVLFAATLPASATELRVPAQSASGIVVIPAGETIDDTVIALGQSVIVEGTVNGDLITVAERVRIPGQVRGSLVMLGKGLSIDGTVLGDVYSASQTLDMRGKVERNVHAAAESLDIATGASVARDAYLAGQRGSVSGTIGRDLHAAGQGFAIAGQVARAVTFSGDGLEITPTARIGGNVTAYVRNAGAVSRASGAQLASEPQIHVSDSQHKGSTCAPARNRWLTLHFYFWQAVRLAAAFGLGLLLYWLVPALFEWPTPSTGRLLKSAGIGFLALVATPIAAVVLAITLVGLPVAVLAMGTWLVGLYLGGILAALVIGRALLRSPRNGARSFILALLIGLALVRIAVNLPFVGGIVWFVLLILGLGLLVAQLGQLVSRLRGPAIA